MRTIFCFLAVSSILAAQELTPKEMQVLEQFDNAPRMVRGGRVEARWFEDGTTFWFEDRFVDPLKMKIRALTDEEKSSWKREEPRQGANKVYSPDHDQYIAVKEGNLWLFPGQRQLTNDGGEDVYWRAVPSDWSPDGSRIIGLKTDAGEVHHVPIIDYSEPLETVREVAYSKAGDEFMRLELAVFDVESGNRIVVDTGADKEVYLFPIGWREDLSEILFLRMTRNAKKLDLMAADPNSGKSRVILTDTQDTFVGGLDFITGGWREYYTPIEGCDEFLWLSERDGWRHIYHYGLDGRLINRLTEGEFPVQRIVAADDEHVFFMANAEERLYDTHLYRVSFNGEGFLRLTEGTGEHQVQMAPSKLCFVDTHSSNTRPPATEVRTADGERLLTLAEADVSALQLIGWTPPEEFVVKADDGKTDLYGVLFKPRDLDPEKKYPVIDFIYAGPFTTVVPNTYASPSHLPRHGNVVAQLGFIVFIVDCRGTVERGKAFQDASYGRIGQIEIPDHVATLRQLAAERPYMDLDRVGIYGASWGGYFTLRAMLTAPDVFHVAVAVAPGDLTESQAINEPYMDLPQNNPGGYAKGSNPAAALNLKGKLLLIHGTADVNAPFSTTMRMVHALVRAGKFHDLLVIPQEDHYFNGPGGMYMSMRTIAYFKEHLLDS